MNEIFQNIIPKDKYLNIKKYKYNNKKILLYLGRINEKRLDILINSFPLIFKEIMIYLF